MRVLLILVLLLGPLGAAVAESSKGKATGSTKSAVSHCTYKRCR